jgi:general transcription factor 3C polypeptide 2
VTALFFFLAFQFIAVAAHPPGSSYHKIGASLTGRGVVQIWCLLNISVNEEEVPPLTKKQKQGPKNNRDMKENSTLVKGPRGRPRKKPIEDDRAITTQSKRPKGRPRKIQIEKYVDALDCNDPYARDLAVQIPEDSSELLAIDWVSGNAQEHAVQEENGKKQKSYEQAASACNPAVETPMQGRRLKSKKRARSCGDNISPELLTQNEDMGSSVTDHQIQHNSGQEPAASDNYSHNGSLGISSASCLISNDVALPRVVLCLAHNGKVAWDVKWRPSNACDSKCKHRMGYLAVLLGNGSLEV